MTDQNQFIFMVLFQNVRQTTKFPRLRVIGLSRFRSQQELGRLIESLMGSGCILRHILARRIRNKFIQRLACKVNLPGPQIHLCIPEAFGPGHRHYIHVPIRPGIGIPRKQVLHIHLVADLLERFDSPALPFKRRYRQTSRPAVISRHTGAGRRKNLSGFHIFRQCVRRNRYRPRYCKQKYQPSGNDFHVFTTLRHNIFLIQATNCVAAGVHKKVPANPDRIEYRQIFAIQ